MFEIHLLEAFLVKIQEWNKVKKKVLPLMLWKASLRMTWIDLQNCQKQYEMPDSKVPPGTFVPKDRFANKLIPWDQRWSLEKYIKIAQHIETSVLLCITVVKITAGKLIMFHISLYM